MRSLKVTPRVHCRLTGAPGGPLSIITKDRTDATVLGELGTAAQSVEVEVKRLVGFLLAVAFDFDRNGLRRLAGSECQRSGLGDGVAVARRGRAVDGADDIVTG